MKIRSIEREQLCGIWAALPLPWRKDGSLDAALFSRDVARCCVSGVHGVYSGGTTGEFYAQDFECFSEVNRIMTETAHAHNVPVQAGCTALSTSEACKRVRYACDIGADIIQIALPFWLELDDDEVVAFFADIATVAGDTPIVHYDTVRSKRRISPKLYHRLCRVVPTLWGTKFGGADTYSVRQITLANPDLKVFVGEHILASSVPMGATGCYSALALLSPSWMIKYYEACHSRCWDRAFEIQNEVNRMFAQLGNLPTPGLQDTALDRIFCQVDQFLECTLDSKGPYRNSTQKDLEHVRSWVRENLPHILHSETATV